jgi:outer membrane protein OmpU
MMKKLLLGSTALVAGGLMAAPAMAADPIKIGVGGYYQFFVQAGGIEGVYALNGTSTQYKGINFIQEGEIHFIGQSKLDNGTTVGLTVELEGWNNSITSTTSNGHTRQIDEAFLFAFGDWGRVEFGSRDAAAYRMIYGAPSALLGWGFIQHNSNFVWANSTMQANKAFFHVTDGAIAGQIQDANRINYFTPRFMGLQVGVGYAPKVNQSAATGPGLVGGICGVTDATTSPNCPTNDYSWQDMIDIGANYLNKFGDVTVALYGAFMMASFVPGFQPLPSASNMVTGFNLTNWRQWNAGVQFGYAGFTIGGLIGYDNNGLGSNYYTGGDNDTRYYAASIMYETGPWQLSAGWMGSYNDNGNGTGSVTTIASGTNATTIGGAATSAAAFGTNQNTGALAFGVESAQKFELGANYALGPGIKLVGGAIYYLVNAPANGGNGQSWAVMLGMDLRF